MRNKLLTLLFVIIDYVTAAVAWGMFYYLRKEYVEKVEFYTNPTFFAGVFLVPIVWISIYFMQGTYHDVRRMYRSRAMVLSFFGSILGTFVLFFIFLLDDEIQGYRTYYQSLMILFTVHFILLLLSRMIFTQWIVGHIHKGKDGFKTLLIGGSDKAVNIYNEIQQLPKGNGNQFIGFINLNGIDRLLESKIPYLGHADKLEEIISKHELEEVIIALESTEHKRLQNIISRIDGKNIKIKILSDMYDIIAGSVKMTNIYGALLMEVNTDPMPIWQRLTKRFLDILFSFIALVILIPVFLILAIMVKTGSKGPVFYRQERVGLNGKIFNILKFRTMFVDAEKSGPQLSSSDDPRITSSGKIMRKMRLDEFPQFLNVIFGEMSLVGPRPERQFFIDKIKNIEPQFIQLTKVRPGITSWGQVKFGYAENVEQMLQRMKFDLLYLNNRSIALDFKIMLYTVMIVFKGDGK